MLPKYPVYKIDAGKKENANVTALHCFARVDLSIINKKSHPNKYFITFINNLDFSPSKGGSSRDKNNHKDRRDKHNSSGSSSRNHNDKKRSRDDSRGDRSSGSKRAR